MLSRTCSKCGNKVIVGFNAEAGAFVQEEVGDLEANCLNMPDEDRGFGLRCPDFDGAPAQAA
jgi:hypothetical protein